jgi:hypothetical protein
MLLKRYKCFATRFPTRSRGLRYVEPRNNFFATIFVVVLLELHNMFATGSSKRSAGRSPMIFIFATIAHFLCYPLSGESPVICPTSWPCLFYLMGEHFLLHWSKKRDLCWYPAVKRIRASTESRRLGNRIPRGIPSTILFGYGNQCLFQCSSRRRWSLVMTALASTSAGNHMDSFVFFLLFKIFSAEF